MISAPARPVPFSLGLPVRMVALGCLFAVELIAISIWIDNDVLGRSVGLTGFISRWGAWSVRLAVAIAFVALIFGESRARGELARISRTCSQHPISRSLLGGHFIFLTAFIWLSAVMFVNRTGSANLLAASWIAIGIGTIALAASALIPASTWRELIRTMGDGLAYALAAGLIACILGQFAWRLWTPLSHWTFFLVKAMLIPIVPAMFTNLAAFSIGTPTFHVEIAPECSGYEGMGLILAFSTAWLWFLRRQWRFPNALLLVPAGVAAMFLLNAVRIATLILIGNAGAPAIALGGFHSQAGWLAFNGVALVMCVMARRNPWFSVGDATSVTPAVRRDSTVAYLLPFLTILAVAMVSRAMSGEFEWAYPLRVIVSGIALWSFRNEYKKMDWRVGWPAVFVGTLVFLLWIGFEPLAHVARLPMPAVLVNSASSVRFLWITIRILGAVVTVPLAEEIAFRGYLLRRVASSDFESVSLKTFSWLPFLISSAAFGLLHGERWLAGMIAGMLYALVTIRRGRIGEAVAAHAVTNALLASWVLMTGNWQAW